MIQQFYSDNTRYVILITEFIENRSCGPAIGKLKIDRIHQIHNQSNTIGKDKNAFCHLLIAFIFFIV